MPKMIKRPEQRALERLSALSYRVGELSSYLQDIASGVSELTQVDWSVVTCCNGDTEQVLASSIDLGDAANQAYSLHGTLTGTVVKTGDCLVVEDASICRKFGEAPPGYQAYLGVPLRTPEGKIIGTICSFHSQPRQFTAAEMQLVRIFAERAATAIDNYQMYHQQQEINAQLQIEIQERQEAEEALRQSEEQLRQITDNLEQVFWLRTPDGIPIYLSPAFETIWGRSRQIWFDSPHSWLESIHPDDRDRVRLAQIQGGDQKVEAEYRMIRPDGAVRIIRDQSFPIRDETGKIYRIAGIAEDITDRKQTEQERWMAISSLAEIGELAAMIVHELRNPLTTVMMGLNACKRLNLPALTQAQLALSLEEADRLSTLLTEILRYAKPQTIQRSPLELNDFIRDVLDAIRVMPSALHHRIEWIPAAMPVTIAGDKDKLKQVLINLLDNACDAVEIGETITCKLIPNPMIHQVKIEIHNGGKPIPSDMLSKLTKPFYTTKPSGTGLGLAIVKRIVEDHQGELSITSASKTGTIVSITLPLCRDKL